MLEIGVALQPVARVSVERVVRGELQVLECPIALAFQRQNASQPVSTVGRVWIVRAQNATPGIEHLPEKDSHRKAS